MFCGCVQWLLGLTVQSRPECRQTIAVGSCADANIVTCPVCRFVTILCTLLCCVVSATCLVTDITTALQGDHLQLLCQKLLGGHKLPSHGTLMAVSAGLFLPTTWLPDLGALSYVGALGVVSALGLTGTW